MVGFFTSLFERYGRDGVADKAAALSYYTIFSLGPLLFVIFGILGEILRSNSAKAQLLDQIQKLMGPKAGGLIEQVLAHQSLSSKTAVSFIIGGVGLVLGAIGIFGQLQKSLNSILHVKTGPGAGLKPVLKQKVVSLGLVGLIAFMLLVSLIASAAISVILVKLHSGSLTGFFLNSADFVASLVIFTLLTVALYRTLPVVKLPWKMLFAGSFAVAILFSLGKSILGIIIGNNSSISAFGAAGALISLLLWIYYSGLIIYIGALGLSVYAESHSVVLKPKYKGKKAVLQTKEVEISLPSSKFAQKLQNKFGQGFSRGWQKKK
jgi:membrane protein